MHNQKENGCPKSEGHQEGAWKEETVGCHFPPISNALLCP